METILLGIVIGSCLILIIYYLLIHARVNAKRGNEMGQNQGVSVVICARNEAENLREHLPRILEQDHPEFEVVVVNDASWDDTVDILNAYEQAYPNLEVVHITEEQKRTAGKKMALTLGFKRAKYERFLLSDADCYPVSDSWIKGMTEGQARDIVIGYGGYEKKPGLLNKMVRFDTWSNAQMYLGAARAGIAYMGVGRNLSYSRSLYDEVGGFRKHYHIISGDDDLFVNEASKRENTEARFDEISHTRSKAPGSWKQWYRQKRRHLSVAPRYRWSSKLFLLTYHSALILFYLSLAAGIALGLPWEWLLGVYLVKTLIHLLISLSSTRVLEENDLLVLLPILEPVSVVTQFFFGTSSLLFRPKAWK